MNTPDFEVHRAIVHSSDVTTGAAEVRIPSLLGAGQVVSVPTTGLTQIGGLWNVPSVGTSTFVAVSADRTQFLWITAVTVPSSGDDQEIVDSLQFNINAGLDANQEGLLVWNEDWGTVDIGLHGTKATLHVGQQVYYYAKNQTGSQIDKGTVVRFDGALGASGHLKMAPFLADGTYPSEYVMGITAHDIPDGDDGYVVHFGAIRGIDTDTPNWNEGDVLYASPTIAGGMTKTVPTAPNNIVLLAAVINRHQQNGELFVRPTIAANILKDEGIVYTNLSDNQLLSYDSAQGVFVNETFSPTITLTGDATGSVTLTDLGSGTLTVTVADDSHSHSNYLLTTGKAADSDLLDGLDLHTGRNNEANKVVRTDGSGYIQAGWINTTSGATTSTISRIYASNDAYVRYVTPATFRSQVTDGVYEPVHSHPYIGTSSTQGSQLYIRNTSPTIYLRDTDHRSGMIHMNSNLMYFLRGSGTDSTSWTTINGAWPLYLNMEDNNAFFGGNIYMRAVNGAHDVIYRTGGMYLTWDSDSYGTNYEHSITSTDGANNWNDNIKINSYGDVRINIDSNNNGSNGFYVGRHTNGSNADLLGITDALVATTYAEWKFRYYSTSNDWSAQPAQLISTTDMGIALRSYDDDASTVQLRPASGYLYCRNHNDGANITLIAAAFSTSSIQYKQDVETWATPKAAGSAVNPEEIVDATSIVKSLRPVTYRWDKSHQLSVSPQSERRKEALKRLNVYRRNKGLKNFTSEELVHQCGRDCDGSPEEPCLYYRNWERKQLGFIAEEAANANIHLTKEGEDGDNTLIDPMAVSATLVKAFQELEARLTALEGS